MRERAPGTFPRRPFAFSPFAIARPAMSIRAVAAALVLAAGARWYHAPGYDFLVVTDSNGRRARTQPVRLPAERP